jgi:PcfJ-like protein
MRPYNLSYVDESNKPGFGRTNKKQAAAVRIDAAIKAALQELSLDEKRQAAFLLLIALVRERTPWLKPASGQGSTQWAAPVFLVNRLRNVAARQGFWIRSLEAWLPDARSLRLTFRSLVHHLFARYPVPGFMDSAWDLPGEPNSFCQQAWFIRLGRGAMLRSLGLPFALTRRMEHFARHAPHHYTVIQALRYGECRGLGCSEVLSRAVVASRLGQEVNDAPFWHTLLLFLAAHPALPVVYVQPIIEFVHAAKFAEQAVLTPDGPSTCAAPWPDFSMEGRTPQSLLRLVKRWNPDLESPLPNSFDWAESGIPAYRFVETRPAGHKLDWTISELLNSGALYAEGRSMCHCVYTYAGKCSRRESSIWSLRMWVAGEQKRCATIEVDLQQQAIIQVRAKYNKGSGCRARQIIRQWATWAGLDYKILS